ncbi:hypothetical protein GCM10012320_17890 [Sinomonas cellulolyticus]|uniref:HtaA domain-containing protein n=1 Tax=Sinomonas cellulolyticus TaxID=2801916 RepID=A0ABS1K6Q5_9MICC|nr:MULTISPECIES: HtaA domain-containing protein [Sinomonas]ASN53383.1 hypothetical protein CGQ25_15815 [Sinomonas sp. R1AF57]MBL0707170.1 HtaA domain-containing protein [Sinomonas cellulolyticus]GHG49852.1 hypothetical protein GCM10012320_17890 [Sinomonas sp. KCTC 49339]
MPEGQHLPAFNAAQVSDRGENGEPLDHRAASPEAPVGLIWGVRASFVTYIRSLSDGSIDLTEGAVMSPEGLIRFRFLGTYEGNGGQWLCFGGGARFLGHGGLLEVPLRNLRVHVVGDGATLYTEQSDGSLFPLGAVALPEPSLTEGTLVWDAAPVALDEAGARFFGSHYRPGTGMDPLWLRLPIGR